MKYFLLFGLIIYTVLPSRSQGGRCIGELIWSDEFNVDGTPNNENWDYRIGDGCDYNICGYGNNEKQYYTSRFKNTRVENGHLIIETHLEDIDNSHYTSARMISQNKQDWKYGRAEIRAILPTGRGTWPAIWMLPTINEYGGWPRSGEIDIMEHVGYAPGKVHGTVHTDAYNHANNTQKGGSTYRANAISEFHTYAIEWYPDSILFFLDDEQYFAFYNEHKTSAEWPFDIDFHLVMNIAIGGNWGGQQGIDNSIFPQRMIIDYVRVYELETPYLSGINYPDQFSKNQTYSINSLKGVTNYHWNVPEGTEILSGQGTAEITVDIGGKSGAVTASFDKENCDNNIFTMEISPVINPTDDTYSIDDFTNEDFSHWNNVPGKDNEIELTNDQGAMKVKFLSDRVYATPYFEYDFGQPFNASELSSINLSLKTNDENLPGIYIYLVDVDGKLTNKNPLYITDIPKNENFRSYSWNFSNQWQSVIGLVDSSKIRSIKFVLDRGEGTFWLDNIILSDNIITNFTKEIKAKKLKFYPNPNKGEFTIKFPKKININDSNIRILDVKGKNIPFEIINSKSQILNIKVGASSGIYYLMNETETYKFLIKK